MGGGKTPGGGTEAATRVADVLLLMMKQDTCGVTFLSRELGISKAVIHRILQSLESRSLVAYVPQQKAYRLGVAAAAIGSRAMLNLDIRKRAGPILHQLAATTNETVTLSALMGLRRVYLDQVESAQEVKMTVELGRAYELHAGASGRVILAHCSSDTLDDVIQQGLPRYTSRTIVDVPALMHELEDIREKGYAMSRGERMAGAGSMAAPVFGPADVVVGSLSVCGPVSRFGDEARERHAPPLCRAAAMLSNELQQDSGRRVE